MIMPCSYVGILGSSLTGVAVGYFLWPGTETLHAATDPLMALRARFDADQYRRMTAMLLSHNDGY